MTRAAACALALGVLLAAPAASAYEEGPSSGDGSRASTDQSGAANDPNRPHTVFRVGAVGAWRGLYDLSILGAGAALSLGFDTAKVGGFANVRFVEGRSAAGLEMREGELTGTVEWRLGGGWRLGIGGGGGYFGLKRATNGYWVGSVGPVALARVGWDFTDYAFVMIDAELQIQSFLSVPAGPTAQIGFKF